MKFMNETTLGIIAGSLTSISMLPQLIKILKEKDSENLSWVTLAILISGLSLWVYYGFLKDDLPVILSNAFAVILNIILLVCFFVYKKK